MTETAVEHVHEWQNVETVRERMVDHSPVSHADCYVRTEVILVQSCGDHLRRVGIGVEDAKRGCYS